MNKKIILYILLIFLLGQNMFAQKGFYVVMVQYTPFGEDSILFYIDEDCFFGTRKRPSPGELKAGFETIPLATDNYAFVNFKTDKKKSYMISRYRNVITIPNMDLAFQRKIVNDADSIYARDDYNQIRDAYINSTFDDKTEKKERKKLSEMKPPLDTASFVSCEEVRPANGANTPFSYTDISTKECILTYSNGKSYPVTVATEIKIPPIMKEMLDFPFHMDPDVGNLLLNILFREDLSRKTVHVEKMNLNEQDKQRLLSAEYDAEIIGLIQYILKLK